MAQNGSLSTKQKRAIAALLTERTTAAAAQAAHVGERTLARWLTQASFQNELAAAQSDLLRLVGARLAGLLAASLAVVDEALHTSDERMRLQAAALVLRHVAALLEYAELEGRLERLEKGVLYEHTETP